MRLWKGGDMRRMNFSDLSPSDLVAIPAFLLALGSVFWQGFLYFKGAELRVYTPEIVEILCYPMTKINTCSRDSNMYIRANSLTFHNESMDKHSAVISNIYLIYELLDSQEKVYLSNKINWKYFSDVTHSSYDRTSVGAIMVAGGNVFSKEIEFFPRNDTRYNNDEKRHFLLWSNFVSAITDDKNKIDKIRLKFYADVLGDNVNFPITCDFMISNTIKKNLLNDNRVTRITRECLKPRE